MSQNDFLFIKSLYSMLCTINTSGNDTIIMGKCLEAFNNFLLAKQKEQDVLEEE